MFTMQYLEPYVQEEKINDMFFLVFDLFLKGFSKWREANKTITY